MCLTIILCPCRLKSSTSMCAVYMPLGHRNLHQASVSGTLYYIFLVISPLSKPWRRGSPVPRNVLVVSVVLNKDEAWISSEMEVFLGASIHTPRSCSSAKQLGCCDQRGSSLILYEKNLEMWISSITHFNYLLLTFTVQNTSTRRSRLSP